MTQCVLECNLFFEIENLRTMKIFDNQQAEFRTISILLIRWHILVFHNCPTNKIEIRIEEDDGFFEPSGKEVGREGEEDSIRLHAIRIVNAVHDLKKCFLEFTIGTPVSSKTDGRLGPQPGEVPDWVKNGYEKPIIHDMTPDTFELLGIPPPVMSRHPERCELRRKKPTEF